MKRKVTQFQSDDVKPGRMKAIFLGCKGPQVAPNGMMIFWEFEVEQDDHTLTVTGVSSDSFNHDPRCKGYKWAKLIDPKLTDDSEDWDDDEAVGNIVGVEVVYREVGDMLISTVKELFTWPQKSPAT